MLGIDMFFSFPHTSCNMAVVQQGREVVSVLSQAIQQLQLGNSKKSTALLRQLRDDASILSTETQDLLQQLHNVQEYYKDQVEVGLSSPQCLHSRLALYAWYSVNQVKKRFYTSYYALRKQVSAIYHCENGKVILTLGGYWSCGLI